LVRFLLTVAAVVQPAELKPKTLEAWQQYIQAAFARMQERLGPQNHFLELDDDEAKRVLSVEILISPAASQGMKKVPFGLIHDWVGTAFIANTTLALRMISVCGSNRLTILSGNCVTPRKIRALVWRINHPLAPRSFAVVHPLQGFRWATE
jgi:hypothetical protein